MARSLYAVPQALAVARVSGEIDPASSGGITAPFGGVVTFCVAKGEVVRAGDVLATIEAMKLEAALTAPAGGRVSRLAVDDLAPVEGGDVVLELEPDSRESVGGTHRRPLGS